MFNSNPFASSSSAAGYGEIYLDLLPPTTPALRTVSYQYPLKLIAPAPVTVRDPATTNREELVHTVFLLTYGGGLVAGDEINLAVRLAPHTRLVLLTQGSTKIFKTPDPRLLSRQRTIVDLGSGSALCYLPDPVQPFAKSAFEQEQIYNVRSERGSRKTEAALCLLDWVCEGRSARGEKWSFHKYRSKNEVWQALPNGKGPSADNRRLLLRDSVTLDDASSEWSSGEFCTRVDSLGVLGTLILCGSLFDTLARFFMSEFQHLPRIGGRDWELPVNDDHAPDWEKVWRSKRQKQDTADKVLWTASNVRGFVIIKFGAKEVESAKEFLRTMLRHEGTIERHFGERALLCLR